MNNKQYYLRRDIKLEPLFNHWYAWPHLIPPATAAMNIVNSHLKIMKSYVAAPEVHMAATENPALRGGPFINYPTNRVKEVKALMERTQRERIRMIELAGAIKTLSDTLRNEAKGYSLETVYQKVPRELKGYVELTYDLDHNRVPSVGKLASDHGSDSYISRRNSMYTDVGRRSVDRGGIESFEYD